MTRVLQVTGSLGIGGAEVMITGAAPHLLRADVQMDFLVFGERVGELEAQAHELGCRVLRMPAPGDLGARRSVTALVDLLRREGPYHVVHSHVNLASGPILAAAHRAGVPTRVAHAHMTSPRASGVRGLAYDVIARWLIRRHATLSVACGNEAGERLYGREWVRRGVVVPNGVETERFLAARASREHLRMELGVASGGLLVGAVARLVEVKNHAFMLELLHEARASGQPVTLALAGDGPLRAELEMLSRDLGVSEHVRFLGLRSDIPDLLAAFDVVIMPSLREGLPVSAVEAQASGTRVLVSDTVTREVDLGLGLVQHLSLSDRHAWLTALGAVAEPPSAEDVRTRFSATGYDARGAAGRLLEIYGVSR